MPTIKEIIQTNAGKAKFADALASGIPIKPVKFKFSDIDYILDPSMNDIDAWAEYPISGYVKVENTRVILLCIVPEEEALKEVRTVGIYLDDGTLFAVGKTYTPIPANLQQVVKIQFSFKNDEAGAISFANIPVYDLDSATLNGYRAGNGENQIPINNGILNKSLNAELLQGYVPTLTPKGHGIPVLNLEGKLGNEFLDMGDGSGLDADTVDGYQARQYGPSIIPITDSNGYLHKKVYPTVYRTESLASGITLNPGETRDVLSFDHGFNGSTVRVNGNVSVDSQNFAKFRVDILVNNTVVASGYGTAPNTVLLEKITAYTSQTNIVSIRVTNLSTETITVNYANLTSEIFRAV